MPTRKDVEALAANLRTTKQARAALLEAHDFCRKGLDLVDSLNTADIIAGAHEAALSLAEGAMDFAVRTIERLGTEDRDLTPEEIRAVKAALLQCYGVISRIAEVANSPSLLEEFMAALRSILGGIVQASEPLWPLFFLAILIVPSVLGGRAAA